MGFKTDREFLRNVSIGAVGTKQVAALLNDLGFRIVELERYSASNKIWSTKVKRLRVPDLLCLRSGIRIESRAKSTLVVQMSHALNKPERAWDAGLRNDDLVAFIQCTQDDKEQWHPAQCMTLFRVADMRSSVEFAGMSARKAVSEGSELRLEWRSTVPKTGGVVSEITQDKIVTKLNTGRTQSYRLGPKKNANGEEYWLNCYAQVGTRFGSGDTILASSVANVVNAPPPKRQYDFLADTESEQRETVYAAIKALGFLPELGKQSSDRLMHLAKEHENDLLRVEAATSLARLNVPFGISSLTDTINRRDVSPDIQMECVLAISEIKTHEAMKLLASVTDDAAFPSELRAAAVWGLSIVADDLTSSGLISKMSDVDEVVAVHAIAGSTRLINNLTIDDTLKGIGENHRQSAGIVRAIVSSDIDCVKEVALSLSLATGARRQWLMYLLACLGREACIDKVSKTVLDELEFFWSHHQANWTNRLDVADQIDFLLRQMLDSQK